MIEIDVPAKVLLTLVASMFLYACAQSVPTKPAARTDPSESAANESEYEEIVVASAESADKDEFEARRLRVGDFERQHLTSSMGFAARSQAVDPLDLLSQTSADEVWIISKPSPVNVPDDNHAPGSGAMLVKHPDTDIPLPLKHTNVNAEVMGYVSSVNVRQQFHNPYDSMIEAVYLFPLPEKAAVHEFLMVIGERTIRGILREKEEAEKIYAAARRAGYTASLLTQHRPNIFEQKVANIEPGKSIDVDIKYFHTLKYEDGWYSFVFPTVVGPRFNPSYSSDPAPAASDIQYLKPGQRSGHDISINVQIDAGVDIESLRSTHKVITEQGEFGQATVRLASDSIIPNKDFKVEFQVAGNTLKSNLLTWEDPATGKNYFSMMLYPPIGIGSLERRNMEMVFVLDASGSMSGQPMQQAKDAVRAALDLLQPGDTFQIIRFSDRASQFGPVPVTASPENIAHAKRYLEQLHGGGGTHMIEGIRAALSFPHDPERLRFVSFLTDGYIGNEVQILAEVHAGLGDSRIFSFGVGSSVNRYLMERMAGVGKGAVAYLGPQDSGYDVMSAFFRRISHPALTDVQIDWNSMSVSDVYPKQIPDLFVGRPIFVTGRYVGSVSTVAVDGKFGSGRHQVLVDAEEGSPALAKLWARNKIAELSDQQAVMGDPAGEYASSILNTALHHQLMSDYTAFIAVDSARRTEDEYGTTVHQSVPVPEGVRYETSVSQQ